MRRIRLALLAGISVLVLSVTAGPSAATEPEITKPCTDSDVDCGEWPEVVEPGTPCKIHVDGEWLEGETDDQGRCVCEYVPPSTTTTSTTVEQTTSTTAPPATSTTVVSPPTTVQQLPTTNGPPSTIRTALVSPRQTGELPRTGSSMTPVLAAIGVALVATGGALVAARRRLTT